MIKENQKIFNFLFAVFNALLCVLAMICAFGVRFYVLSASAASILRTICS